MTMFDARPKWFNMQVLLTKISKREIPMKTSALLATLLAALALSALALKGASTIIRQARQELRATADA